MPEFRGVVFDDVGVAVQNATVNLYDADSTSPSRANAVTDSSGLWHIGETGTGSDGAASVDFDTRRNYDVKIANGTDVVWLRSRDRYQVSMMQAWQADGATVPAAVFTNAANATSSLVAIFEGDKAHASAADNDEAYNSYKLSDDGGNQEEVARVTWHQYDVNPTADGGFEIEVASAGTLYKVFDAVTATGGAQTISIGTGLSGTTINIGHGTSEVNVKDNLTVVGDLTLDTVAAAGTDTDKFLVLDGSGNVDYRTGTQVLSDIGAAGSKTYGISDDNAVEIDGADIADNEYARFTANGLESRTAAEVAADIESSIDAVGTIGTGVWQVTPITSSYINAAQTGITSLGTQAANFAVGDGYGVVIGTATQETVSIGDGATDLVPELQVLGTAAADSSMLLAAFSTTATTAGSPILAFAKGGNATLGSHTVVTDGEELGNIIAFGDDGTDLETPAASIQFEVDGTPGSGDMPGRIILGTTADGATAVTEAVRIDASQDVTFAGAIKIADDESIIFGAGSDASIEYDENGTDQLRIAGTGVVIENDVEIADSKFLEFASAAGTPTTDNTVQGVVIEFLAAEAITQFDAVYISTTTGRVGRALATNAAKMPVIGIAIEAQGSAGSSVRVLTHGVYRDDGGFGGNMTVGVPLYAPEANGTLTVTRPSDDGDLVQVIGMAAGVRSAFINPSMDVIEHA